MNPEPPVRLTSAQRTLVENNLGLAQRLSHEHARKSDQIDIDEVVAVAYIGLIKAAQNYQESKNDSFSGYARIRIRGEITDWQRSTDFLRRQVRTDYKTLEKAGLGDTDHVSDSRIRELSKKTGLSVIRIETVLRLERAKPHSFQDHNEETLHSDDASVESSMVVSDIKANVALVVQSLSPLQQTVLAMHYFEDTDLRVIAPTLGISIAAVREAHAEAILLIHAEMVRRTREA